MMRANSTQKAYDEAFLACSTAVYFESQSNEQEALRSWKSALDQIYYHNAHRAPSASRTSSETERALVDSLHQLELQCKERVDLLETLKKSREEANENKPAAPADTDTPPPPPPHKPPLGPAESNGPSSWLGGGTIPPVVYTDLSRPPLPTRPSLPPRKSSGPTSNRVLSQTPGGASLSPASTARKDSRTPSPEKKGRMLRTLRPGRDSRSSSTKLASSMRSKPPDAAKAATQAWAYKPAPGSSKLSRASAPPLQNVSSRSSFDRPSSGLESERPIVQPPNHEAYLPQAPFYLKSNEMSGSLAHTAPPPGNGSDPDLPIRTRRKDLPSSGQRSSFDAGRVRSNAPAMPSYRNEYPETISNVRLLAASAAARSWTELESGKGTPPAPSPYQQPIANNSRMRTPRKELPEPIALEADDNESKTRPPSRRKGKGKVDTARADLPHRPNSEDEDSDGSEQQSDEWQERVRSILKNLPRGVDEAAAKQILNEIVIQGDEVHWDDVAGLDIAKSALKETVVYPFLRPDLFMGLREPARGMLLFGPPGTGKTMLARAVATESKSTFFAISASSLTSKFLGESEKLVRALFALAKLLAPSIIFVDEIDSLLSSRSGSGEHEATRRIKTEFLIQWSDLAKAAAGREQTDRDKEKGDATRVLVLAATNLPWAIDEAARRRFVRRQYIPLPEDHVRKSQVKTLLSHQKHELSETDLDRLVVFTEGFSGSDITALAKDAAMGPLRSLGEKLLHMTMDEIRPIRFEDFEASLVNIRPSVGRQGLKEYEDWAREFGERGG
ncbi:AAA-domain-containing protein [Lentithecium fluviatile CBS 122367]|uniref:AAA-domain-containing protein n=1 Tax=Lentithecium fluviatile CBS 122367 TaxID=1168545 RepID=A0A6G1J6K4_9PLEO|nr:AAA-domain-containing protein [Lentithecium fluviatile CBS 122367]